MAVGSESLSNVPARGDLRKKSLRSLRPFPNSCQTVVGAFIKEVARRITEEILVRANEAIGRGEAKGPKLDQGWKRIEKLNGGIVGVKSWEQIKRIAEASLADGQEGADRQLRPHKYFPPLRLGIGIVGG